MNTSILIRDLCDIPNIIDDFKIPMKENFLDSKEYEDFHETLEYFISDFIDNNLYFYPDKHFDE